MAMPEKPLISVKGAHQALFPGLHEAIVGSAVQLYLETAKHRSLPIGRTLGHAATSRRSLEMDASWGVSPFRLCDASTTRIYETPKLRSGIVRVAAPESS